MVSYLELEVPVAVQLGLLRDSLGHNLADIPVGIQTACLVGTLAAYPAGSLAAYSAGNPVAYPVETQVACLALALAECQVAPQVLPGRAAALGSQVEGEGTPPDPKDNLHLS